MISTLNRQEIINLFKPYTYQGQSIIQTDQFRELLNLARPDCPSNETKELFRQLALLNGFSFQQLTRHPPHHEQKEIRNIICLALLRHSGLTVTIQHLADITGITWSTMRTAIRTIKIDILGDKDAASKYEKVAAQLDGLICKWKEHVA